MKKFTQKKRGYKSYFAGDDMFDYKNIYGIDVLKEKLPPELQNWHCFGKIVELNYCSKDIDEFYCDYTNNDIRKALRLCSNQTLGL